MQQDYVRDLKYLAGNDSYERDWTTEFRKLHGHIALNKRPIRCVAAPARCAGAHRVKRSAQRVRVERS